ncbi:MAG TPA: rhodanese-like domain-containing protein [Desulfuromonadaceae bacterium]|jgi:rhodanese-related sulfurtransferase
MDKFEITVEEVKNRLENNEPLFFLNVLHHQDHHDWSVVKPRGALQLHHDKVEQHLDEIPSDRKIILYATGPGKELELEVAQLLRQHGRNDVYHLVGGLFAYCEAGLPVEGLGEEARKAMYL